LHSTGGSSRSVWTTVQRGFSTWLAYTIGPMCSRPLVSLSPFEGRNCSPLSFSLPKYKLSGLSVSSFREREHFLFILLRNLMFQANANTTHSWSGNREREPQMQPFAESSIMQKCRDIDSLLRWLDEHNVSNGDCRSLFNPSTK
jgi:hypothetical protein